MFAKDEEIRLDETEEEEKDVGEDEALKDVEEPNTDRFTCSYGGFFDIKQDSSTMVKVPEDKCLQVKIFFDNLGMHQQLAKKN